MVVHRVKALLFTIIAGATCGALALGSPASAHPTDELLQLVYIIPHSTSLTIEVELTPGLLIASSFASAIDTDSDGQFSDAEIAAHMVVVRDAITATLDGVPLQLQVTEHRYPDRSSLVAGAPISIMMTAPAKPSSALRTVAATYRYDPLTTSVQASVTYATDDPVAVRDIQHSDDGRTITARYRAAGATSAVPSGGDASGTTIAIAVAATAITLVIGVVAIRRRAQRRRDHSPLPRRKSSVHRTRRV